MWRILIMMLCESSLTQCVQIDVFLGLRLSVIRHAAFHLMDLNFELFNY